LSRRLGDDPLTRARSERAKAAQAAGPATSDDAGQAATVVEVKPSSRASLNDVFFQRKEAGAPVQPVAGPATEAPEITEISEIPEIREATATAASQSGIESDYAPSGDQAVAAAPQISIIEEAVAKLNASVPAAAVAQASDTVAPEASTAAPAADPQKTGGFFKRLFGKFK
jgi:hypothetical protein